MGPRYRVARAQTAEVSSLRSLLSAYLENHHVDVARINGEHGKKRLEDLLAELVRGECVLREDKSWPFMGIRRWVRVVRVKITVQVGDQDYVLLERQQQIRGGIRGVDRVLAGKCMGNESAELAASREVAEELGCTFPLRNLVGSHRCIDSESSGSYGIESKYDRVVFTARVNAEEVCESGKFGLQLEANGRVEFTEGNRQFRTTENEEENAVAEHVWEWVPGQHVDENGVLKRAKDT